jgi:peroxiredoxin
MIEAGQPAPDFALPDQDGKEVSLESLRGRSVLLVFYPNDFSPVCTDQLSVYQEALGELEGRGVELYGVSVDSAYCHRAFRDHLDTTIPLLADFNPKGQVARSFGVYSEDYGVSTRALVLIGPDGVVRWAYRSPSPLEIPGTDLILQALDEQRAA